MLRKEDEEEHITITIISEWKKWNKRRSERFHGPGPSSATFGAETREEWPSGLHDGAAHLQGLQGVGNSWLGYFVIPSSRRPCPWAVPAMAGCSTLHTTHTGPGDDAEDAGQLLRLRDTLRVQISDLVKVADRALEQRHVKPGTLKTLYESAQQKQITLVQLDNQVRNLLDIDDYTKEYEESDLYLGMIFRIIFLLRDTLSKNGYMCTTLQDSKGKSSWRPPEIVTKGGSLRMTRSVPLASPVTFEEPFVPANESLTAATLEAATKSSVCVANSASCVALQPLGNEEADKLGTGPVECVKEHSVLAPLDWKGSLVNTGSNRRGTEKLNHRDRRQRRTGRLEVQTVTTAESKQRKGHPFPPRSGMSAAVYFYRRKRRPNNQEPIGRRQGRRPRHRVPQSTWCCKEHGPRIVHYLAGTAGQSFDGIPLPALNRAEATPQLKASLEKEVTDELRPTGRNDHN